MGLAIRMAVTFTPPELTGVLVWWGIMLAAPTLLLRRWRRRHRGGARRRLWPSARHRRSLAPTPEGPQALAGARERRAERSSGFAESHDESRPSLGALPSARRTPGYRGPRSRSDSGPGEALVRRDARAALPVCGLPQTPRARRRELERKLSVLPADRWRVEPYPLTGERGNTRLLLGETGVFVISATYAPGHWDDVLAASTLAGKVQRLLPGYVGQVQPAICHPFTSARPRLWHRPDEHGDWVGAWVLGGDSVIDWLEHFGCEHGLGPRDLKRFDELAKPNWLKPAIATPPSWPPIPEPAPPGTTP